MNAGLAKPEPRVSESLVAHTGLILAPSGRYLPQRRTDEDALTQAILALGVKYGRYGYRRITVLLRNAGWPVGKDRVQRFWRREGTAAVVPHKRPFQGAVLAYLITGDPEPGRRSLTRILSSRHITNGNPT